MVLLVGSSKMSPGMRTLLSQWLERDFRVQNPSVVKSKSARGKALL